MTATPPAARAADSGARTSRITRIDTDDNGRPTSHGAQSTWTDPEPDPSGAGAPMTPAAGPTPSDPAPSRTWLRRCHTSGRSPPTATPPVNDRQKRPPASLQQENRSRIRRRHRRSRPGGQWRPAGHAQRHRTPRPDHTSRAQTPGSAFSPHQRPPARPLPATRLAHPLHRHVAWDACPDRPPPNQSPAPTTPKPGCACTGGNIGQYLRAQPWPQHGHHRCVHRPPDGSVQTPPAPTSGTSTASLTRVQWSFQRQPAHGGTPRHRQRARRGTPNPCPTAAYWPPGSSCSSRRPRAHPPTPPRPPAPHPATRGCSARCWARRVPAQPAPTSPHPDPAGLARRPKPHRPGRQHLCGVIDQDLRPPTPIEDLTSHADQHVAQTPRRHRHPHSSRRTRCRPRARAASWRSPPSGVGWSTIPSTSPAPPAAPSTAPL